jgi:hypothetical protein
MTQVSDLRKVLVRFYSGLTPVACLDSTKHLRSLDFPLYITSCP